MDTVKFHVGVIASAVTIAFFAAPLTKLVSVNSLSVEEFHGIFGEVGGGENTHGIIMYQRWIAFGEHLQIYLYIYVTGNTRTPVNLRNN